LTYSSFTGNTEQHFMRRLCWFHQTCKTFSSLNLKFFADRNLNKISWLGVVEVIGVITSSNFYF